MNRHILSIILILALLVPTSLMAQPPKPQEGFRWVLNEEFSDEFNGDKLDLEKWYDYHPGWVGRQPAIFLPSQVSVKDGLLQIKNKKLEKDTVVTFWNGTTGTYSIAGGAVVSRTRGAHYGYYECSQKASKIRMSSTFWMTSKSYPGPDPCSGDNYSQELDIQESVGGIAPGHNALKSMGSNSHFNYTTCDGVKTNYSAGAHIDLEEGVEVSDTFHVYAAHWKNANRADLYLNGKYGNALIFRTDILDEPFSKPMQINMVTETYDWVTPPTDEDLADDERNTTYIDWVRSWKLVEVDYEEEDDANLIKNGGFESGDFSSWGGWGGAPKEVVSNNVHSGNYAMHIGGPGAPEYEVNLRSFANYTLSCYGKVIEGSGPIHFAIKDTEENVLGGVDVTETSYTKKNFTFTTGSSAAGLKLYFYAPSAGVEGYADDFSLVLTDHSDTVKIEQNILEENILFEAHPSVLQASEIIKIPVSYKANGDRLIHLQLRDADSTLIAASTYPALAGYGVKGLKLILDSVPSPGDNFLLITEIMHQDSSAADPSQRDILTLNLRDSVRVSMMVMNSENNSPVEGAEVIINGSVSQQTSTEGMAVFEKVPAGKLTFTVIKDGFEGFESEESELDGDSLFQISLDPYTYVINIAVRDETSKQAIPSAAVILGAHQVEANLSGIARIPTVAGSYALQASAPNFHPYQGELVVSKDSTLDISLLRSHASVNFVVKLDDSSLYNATVQLDDRAELTSAIGLASFDDVPTIESHSYTIIHEEEELAEGNFSIKTDTTIRINIQTLGIPLAKGSEGLQIFPNPSDGSIRISGLRSESYYTIKDVRGATLKEGRTEKNHSINLSDLAPGVYFVNVEGYTPMKLIRE